MKRIAYFAALALLLSACAKETVPGATAIRLDKNELTLDKGASETLTVTFTPRDVTDKSLVWESSDKNVAEVTDGVVVGVDVGSTEITVKHGSLTDKCTVTVREPFTFQAVDLGLSVEWANANLGASAPEGFGDYYAWGETDPKEEYNWSTYKFCNGDADKLIKYNTSSWFGTVDNRAVLDAADDVASVKLGDKWRMPTGSEVDELISTMDNSSYRWEKKSINGHDGWLVTYLVNNNSIFLPAAGRRYDTNLDVESGWYWSSSINPETPSLAYYMCLSYGFVRKYDYRRYFGFSVRPVYGDVVSASSVSLNETGLTLYEGETKTIVAMVNPADVPDKSVTWSSSNTSVATVSGDGVVTAVKAGNATITVMTNIGGKTATCPVTVISPSSIEAVDLGLPSGLKWASCNIGALFPAGYGEYYAWGETSAKSNYDWETYKWCNRYYDSLTKYNSSSSHGTVDNKTVLDAEDDVAHVRLGGKWRMPTLDEWGELYDKCTRTWTIMNGVNGLKYTGPNGKSIFLPAAGYQDGTSLNRVDSDGYYWSSSPITNNYNPSCAWCEWFSSSDLYSKEKNRCLGQSVRPVSD